MSDHLLKFIDATAGRLACLLLGWWDYLLCGGRSPASRPNPESGKARRILVIRPGGMGDMILLLPALQALEKAYPHDTVDILCERRNAAAIQFSALTCRVMRYDGNPWHLWRRLRRNRYDIVVDTEQFHNLSALIARLTGAPRRIGFKINPVRNLLYTHLINYALDGAESNQFMRLLEPFGLADQALSLEGILAPVASDPADTFCSAPANAVAVYAGASTPYKQWPIENFERLIAFITEELESPVILVGGHEAAATSRYLTETCNMHRKSGTEVVSAAGRLSLVQTAEILRQARFFIGADCGLTHLAVGLGTPTVTLFGPSDPLKWGHQNDRHQILHKGLSCSPCFIFGYHRLCRTRDCMTAITIEEAAEACRRAKLIKP